MRATLSGTAAGFLLLTLSCHANAQAPRYVMKDLPKPATALYCTGAVAITDAGDVIKNCTYKGGTRPENARFCLSSNWCIHYTTRLPWYYDLPTVWQANGTVRTLTFPTRTSSWQVFALNSGAFLSYGMGLDANGRNTEVAYWTWRPGSNVAEPYLPPAALPSKDMFMFALRRTGLSQWNRNGSDASYMVSPTGQVSPTPQIPPSSDVVRYPGDNVFNDQGLRVATRWVQGPATQAEPFGTALPQAWFFNGQQWTRMALPNQLTNLNDIQINAQGHVVGHDNYSVRYLWRADQPGTIATLPGPPWGSEKLFISDTGVIGGAVANPGDNTGRSRATIWVQGQPIDLNTLTVSKPSNLLLMLVQAMNGKGQMVVSASDGKTDDAALKTVLVTPQ